MRPPRPGLASTPPLASAFVLGNGRRRIGGPGEPAGVNTRAMFCHPLGLCGLGSGVGHGRLRGPWPRVHDEQTEGLDRASSVRICHFHLADDTVSMPASRGLLTGPARFCADEGQRALLLAPRLHLLTHRTRAWDQRDQAYALLQAQPQHAFTVRFTVGHDAVHPVETKRHTFLDRHGSVCTVTRIASPQAHAEWEALTAHTETQEDLLAIITPLFALPLGRPGWDKPRHRADLLLRGAIQADRCGILLAPGCREGIDLQGVEGDRTKHAGELRGK